MGAQDNIQKFLQEPTNGASAATMPPTALKQQEPREQLKPAPQPKQPVSSKQPVNVTIEGTGAGAQDTVAATVGAVVNSVSNTGDAIDSWASNLPTPGGIAVLLFVLFVFLWAIVPVLKQDGQTYTRLQLLWYTLTGRTQLGGPAETDTGFGAVTSNGTPQTVPVTTIPVNGNAQNAGIGVLSLPDFTPMGFGM